MKKSVYLVILFVMAFSEISWEHRFGDAWNHAHGHFRRRFYGGRQDTPAGLFTLFSTTITSASVTSFTSGGDLSQASAEYREYFIDENLYAIKLDSAKGQGEYLKTL